MPHDEVKTEDLRNKANQREEVGELRAHRQGWGLCSLLADTCPGRAAYSGSLDTLSTALQPLSITPPWAPRGWVAPLPVIHSLPARAFLGLTSVFYIEERLCLSPAAFERLPDSDQLSTSITAMALPSAQKVARGLSTTAQSRGGQR